MKKLLQIFIPILCVSFLCGCEESAQKQQARLIKENLKADKNLYKYEKKANKNLYKYDKKADKNLYKYEKKADKNLYKYEKKALKREYKLEKLRAKVATYKALSKITQDTNDIDSNTTSVVHQHIEKHRDKGNNSSVSEPSRCSICGAIGNKDTEWIMLYGKLICLDCYKKREASKEKAKTGSR